MAPTVKDVAQLAQVSIATVSRVFSGKPHIRENTQKRVLQAAQQLDYKPSRLARSLRVQSSRIIGLIISDIQNPFFTALVRAVEDESYLHDYAIFLCNSDESSQKEELYIDLMLAEKVAGVIITPESEFGSKIYKLVQAGIPVVAVDRSITNLDVDTVLLDNVTAAFNLVRYVIGEGHRRIGAVLGSLEKTTGRERYLGYREALDSCNIPVDPELVHLGMPKESLGFQYTCELLELPDPPTAIFTGNNLLNAGALRAIREKGLRIPEDISLCGFDDIQWTSLVSPPITVVSQPVYQIGQKAVDLILDHIANPLKPTTKLILNSNLLIRGSIATLPDKNKQGGEYSGNNPL
jgi:DNA-binding LacI/PurR family transcriptional regulator